MGDSEGRDGQVVQQDVSSGVGWVRGVYARQEQERQVAAAAQCPSPCSGHSPDCVQGPQSLQPPSPPACSPAADESSCPVHEQS